MSAGVVARLAADVRGGRADPRRLCSEALSAARAAPDVFWEVDAEGAPADAETVLRSVAGGAAAPALLLAGVPVAIKDSFAVRGLPRHLGLARADVSDRDAAAVARLRAAGAVVVGTTAMDQLAWTMSGAAPGRGACRNPLVPGHSPGGSSGGAAAAVAAGIVPLSLAGDSAGSARVPAAWCGVVGFKPSFGAIDLDGCAPLAPCLDTASLVASHVDDCAVGFAALTSAPAQPPAHLAAPRLGVPAAFVAASGCEPDVAAAFASALERLQGSGLSLRDVDGPPGVPGVGALFAANLAARWGDVVDSEPEGRVHPDVRSGVDHGRRLTACDHVLASDALAAARRAAPSLFADVDVLAVPTAPILPPPSDAPAPVRVASALTRAWSVLGCPAISMPCSVGRVRGFGLQLVARPGDEARLLRWAGDLEDLVADR